MKFECQVVVSIEEHEIRMSSGGIQADLTHPVSSCQLHHFCRSRDFISRNHVKAALLDRCP